MSLLERQMRELPYAQPPAFGLIDDISQYVLGCACAAVRGSSATPPPSCRRRLHVTPTGHWLPHQGIAVLLRVGISIFVVYKDIAL